MSKVNEFTVLTELMRRVSAILGPYEPGAELEKFQNKTLMDALIKKNPKCFISLKKAGASEVPFLPICNTNGVHDPFIMKNSMAIANKIAAKEGIDKEFVRRVIIKLTILHRIYSRDIPRPHSAGYYKGKTTTVFNQMRDYLKDRGNS